MQWKSNHVSKVWFNRKRVVSVNNLVLCCVTVSSSLIELSVLESAVQDCTQSCNEAM